MCGGGFLRGDGVADAVEQCDDEREVDGARDARAVFEVECCEVGDDGFGGGSGEAVFE